MKYLSEKGGLNYILVENFTRKAIIVGYPVKKIIDHLKETTDLSSFQFVSILCFISSNINMVYWHNERNVYDKGMLAITMERGKLVRCKEIPIASMYVCN